MISRLSGAAREATGKRKRAEASSAGRLGSTLFHTKTTPLFGLNWFELLEFSQEIRRLDLTGWVGRLDWLGGLGDGLRGLGGGIESDGRGGWGKHGGLTGRLAGGGLDDDVVGLGELALDIVLGLVELVHCLAETTGQLGQFLGSKEDEDDGKNEEGIRPGEVQ